VGIEVRFICPEVQYDTAVFQKDCLSKAMYKSDFGGQRNYGPREMTKVICSDCGKECEVPFKPTEGRPVYCQECLPKHRRPRF
jgi:CxxC-x17-CxxC domain-containing protein